MSGWGERMCNLGCGCMVYRAARQLQVFLHMRGAANNLFGQLTHYL